MRLRHTLVLLVLLAFTPAASRANPRLVSVTPVDGGCVAGPTGPNVEAWDVEAGRTYVVRIDRVFDVANHGTLATMNVMVKNSATGNVVVTANLVSPTIYEFTYTMPSEACATSPVRCGVIGSAPSTGVLLGRHDDGTSQAHLRASTFGAGCTNPTPIGCWTSPTTTSTWGALKSIYR